VPIFIYQTDIALFFDQGVAFGILPLEGHRHQPRCVINDRWVRGILRVSSSIGHKNKTIIIGPGGYRFGDHWRFGLLPLFGISAQDAIL
jgi:hypothetical protein